MKRIIYQNKIYMYGGGGSLYRTYGTNIQLESSCSIYLDDIIIELFQYKDLYYELYYDDYNNFNLFKWSKKLNNLIEFHAEQK